MKGMKQVNIMISPSGNDARSMQHARNTKNRRSCQQKVVMESWTKFTHYHFWTGSRKIQRQPSKCPISLLLSSSMYFIAAKQRLMLFSVRFDARTGFSPMVFKFVGVVSCCFIIVSWQEVESSGLQLVVIQIPQPLEKGQGLKWSG